MRSSRSGSHDQEPGLTGPSVPAILELLFLLRRGRRQLQLCHLPAQPVPLGEPTLARSRHNGPVKWTTMSLSCGIGDTERCRAGQGPTESPWRKDGHHVSRAPPTPTGPARGWPRAPLCVPESRSPTPCGLISRRPMTHHPACRPCPSSSSFKGSFEPAARLMHKAREVSRTQRRAPRFSLWKHNLTCSDWSARPAARSPNQLKTKGSWRGPRGLLSATPTHAASTDSVRGSPSTDPGGSPPAGPAVETREGTRGTWDQGPRAVPTGAACAGHRRPRHGRFVLILEPFQPEEGCGGLVAKPSHVRVPDTALTVRREVHVLTAPLQVPHAAGLALHLTPTQVRRSPRPGSPSTVSVNQGSLRSEVLKWKIPGVNNSWVLNCVLFRAA